MDTPFRAQSPHHLGVLVDDIPVAAAALARSIGAGPFFELPEVTLEPDTTEMHMPGGLEWAHSIALGSAGPVLIELTRTTALSPGRPGTALSRAPLNHLAFATTEWDDAVSRLVATGAKRLFTIRSPQIHTAYLDHPILGTVEVLRDTPALAALVAAVAAASTDWDGSEPHRLGPPQTMSARRTTIR